VLQGKFVSAGSQSMKDKYEGEMKKQIKKLQRYRDFFRSS